MKVFLLYRENVCGVEGRVPEALPVQPGARQEEEEEEEGEKEGCNNTAEVNKRIDEGCC